MKHNYDAPQVEIIEMEIEDAVLQPSEFGKFADPNAGRLEI